MPIVQDITLRCTHGLLVERDFMILMKIQLNYVTGLNVFPRLIC